MTGTSKLIKTHDPQKKSPLNTEILGPQKDLFGEVSSYYLEQYAKSCKSPKDKAYKTDFYDPDNITIKKFVLPPGLHGEDKTPACFSGFIKGECQNGHRFAKAILCGKEYCVDCGEKWSWVHQRRYYRWLPKINTFKTVGYLVITLPKEVRACFLDKDKLNEFRRYVIRLMKRNGYERGLSRWHWCGDDGKTWHPHLNLLFEEMWIDKDHLVKLRDLILAKLKLMVDRPVKTIVINYSYSDNRVKHRHWLRYVTRATFRKFNDDIYGAINGYRNNVIWGKWTKDKKQNEVATLERGNCPICNTKINWAEWAPEIDDVEWHYLKAGYFVWEYKVEYG